MAHTPREKKVERSVRVGGAFPSLAWRAAFRSRAHVYRGWIERHGLLSQSWEIWKRIPGFEIAPHLTHVSAYLALADDLAVLLRKFLCNFSLRLTK